MAVCFIIWHKFLSVLHFLSYQGYFLVVIFCRHTLNLNTHYDIFMLQTISVVECVLLFVWCMFYCEAGETWLWIKMSSCPAHSHRWFHVSLSELLSKCLLVLSQDIKLNTQGKNVCKNSTCFFLCDIYKRFSVKEDCHHTLQYLQHHMIHMILKQGSFQNDLVFSCFLFTLHSIQFSISSFFLHFCALIEILMHVLYHLHTILLFWNHYCLGGWQCDVQGLSECLRGRRCCRCLVCVVECDTLAVM